MNMKAIHLIYMMVGMLGLTACSDSLFEEGTTRPVKTKVARLTATIKQGTTPAKTRALMIDNPGTNIAMKWEGGDRIGVFGNNGNTNTACEIKSEDIYNSGRQASFNSDFDGTIRPLLGYFPYDTSAKLNANGDLVLTMPTTQQYAEEDYLSKPVAAYCLMAAKGDTKDGLTFRNVTAMLKIGLIGSETDKRQKVRKVFFRDLDGKAVCGEFTVIWNGDEPSTTFGGGGTTLTLDCGTDGVILDTLRTCPFFMSVPARHYPKGFELVFELTDGKQITKTIGTIAGKTLLRSIVYPVGDFQQEIFENCSVKMKPNAHVVDADLADRMTINRLYYNNGVLSTNNIIDVEDPNNEIKVGDILLFQPSETFPSGMAVKVGRADQYTGTTRKQIFISPCGDFAEAFDEIKIGEPCWNDDGTFIEDKAVKLNLNKYLQKIVLPDGEEVFFDRDGDEITLELPFENRLDNEGGSSMTRALDDGMIKMKDSFTTPTLSVKLGKDDPEAEDPKKKGHGSIYLGAKVTFDAHLVLNAADGALNYAGLSITPIIKAKCDFAMSGEFSAETNDKYLFTAVFGGLVIGGVPVTFDCDFYAKASLYGSIELKGTVNYQKTLNSYGFSYIKGQGFAGRSHFVQPDENEGFNAPEMGLTGTIGVKGTITPRPKVHVYGLFEVGVRAPMDMKFEVSGSLGSSDTGLKMSLTPAIGLEPFVATLGGAYTKTFKDFANVEFDPIWERWITPNITDIKLSPIYTYVDESEMGEGSVNLETGERHSKKAGYERIFGYGAVGDFAKEANGCPRNGIKGINYSFTVSRRLVKETKLGIAIYKGDVSLEKLFQNNASYRNISYPDYWPSYGTSGMNNVPREFLNPEFVTILPIATYKDPGEEEDASITYSGTVNYAFENGQGYGMDIVAYYGGEDSSIRLSYPINHDWYDMYGLFSDLTWFKGVGYKPFKCYWPNTFDGSPWPQWGEPEE